MLAQIVSVALLHGGVLGVSPATNSTSQTPRDPSSTSTSTSDEGWRDRVDARRVEQLKRSLHQRTLGNHPFVRPQFITSALPTSHFGLTVGAGGLHDQDRDQDQMMASNEGGSYFVSAAGAGADAGVRITKWVGLDGQVTGLAGVSREPAKLLGVGASSGYTWSASVVVRALQRKTTALSVRPQIRGLAARGLSLNPGLAAVGDQLAQGKLPDLGEAARYTSTQDSALGGLVHVALAQSITRFVGLQVDVAGGGERQRQRFYDGEDQDLRAARGLFQSGLAVSVDVHPVPLAIMAEYNFNLAIGTGAQAGDLEFAHNVGGGVFFNALTNTIGVTVAANLAEERRTLVGMFSFRGYF